MQTAMENNTYRYNNDSFYDYPLGHVRLLDSKDSEHIRYNDSFTQMPELSNGIFKLFWDYLFVDYHTQTSYVPDQLQNQR